MKSFFKIFIASLLGFIIGIFVLVFIIGGIASAGGKKVTEVPDKAILHLNFKGPISDRPKDNPLADFMGQGSPIALRDLLEAIDMAANDSRISGIFLDIENIPAGLASAEELREALLEFKKSGKFIIAYSEQYGQYGYYLASLADEIYTHPMGYPELKGLRSELMFYKGVLEKIGVEPIVIRHGKFKSAIEPFISDKMSPENRQQIQTLLNSFWGNFLQNVALSRKTEAPLLQQIANNLLVTTSKEALDYKLVDKIAYRNEVLENLVSRTGAESIQKLTLLPPQKYIDAKDPRPARKGDKIAIIYAEGDIVDGDDKESVSAVSFSKIIRKVREDKKIKAVVLRINSPGGSALASETIWQELQLTRKEKPVIVSMGDVAASGGYYIACAADSILADANTITGSIGVFGLFFNAKKLLNEKLGVTIDTVKTARYADILSSSRPITESERAIAQRKIEEIYDRFIGRVADARGLTKAQVDSIGQGRVWSGADARSIGLVDEIGGLKDAIAIAAKKAGMDNYRLESFPKKTDPIMQLIEKLSGSGDSESAVMAKMLGNEYWIFKQYKQIKNMHGEQTRMPFVLDIH